LYPERNRTLKEGAEGLGHIGLARSPYSREGGVFWITHHHLF
jgi:hypothetical protein